MTVASIQYNDVGRIYFYFHMFLKFKENLYACQPSEHPPDRGGNCQTFRWEQQGQHYSTVQYNVGVEPTVILYTSIINHHAGTGQQTKQETENTMNLDTAQFSYIGLGSDSCQYFRMYYIVIFLAIKCFAQD